MTKADVAIALASTDPAAVNDGVVPLPADADWLEDSAVGRFLLDICLSIPARSRLPRPL